MIKLTFMMERDCIALVINAWRALPCSGSARPISEARGAARQVEPLRCGNPHRRAVEAQALSGHAVHQSQVSSKNTYRNYEKELIRECIKRWNSGNIVNDPILSVGNNFIRNSDTRLVSETCRNLGIVAQKWLWSRIKLIHRKKCFVSSFFLFLNLVL